MVVIGGMWLDLFLTPMPTWTIQTDQAGSNYMIQNFLQASSSEGSTGDEMDTSVIPYDPMPIALLNTKPIRSILKKPSNAFPINDIPMSETACNRHVNNNLGQPMSDQEQDGT